MAGVRATGAGQPNRYDLFLSYSRADAKPVEILASRLAQAGLRVWLDTARLTPGASWRERIEAEMNRCDAAVIVLGRDGLGAVQRQERDLAYVIRDHRPDFLVVHLLLPGVAPPTASWANVDTWIQFVGGLDEAEPFELLIATLKRQSPPSKLRSDLPDRPAPYRGLKAFGSDHAALFFGRDAEIAAMRERLDYHPLLAVIGPSGSGKTSLVEAGFIGRLRSREGTDERAWAWSVVRPGTDPLSSVAAALAPPGDQAGERLAESDRIRRRLAERPADLPRLLTSQIASPGMFLLVIDRFEELFTLCKSEAERRGFIEALLACAGDRDGRIRIVLTLRADFYGQLGPYGALADAVAAHQIYLRPLREADVVEIIEAPATRVGALFEKGLAEQIRGDSLRGGEVVLPLLEHTLDLLWRKRRGRYLVWDAYREIGGVAGALRYHADRVVASLSEPERDIARRLFTRLLWLEGDGGAVAGRRVEKPLLIAQCADPAAAERVLQRLADDRLLLVRRRQGLVTVELIHDTLPLHWEWLLAQVKHDREFLLWRQRLQGHLREWRETEERPEALMRGALLTEAEGWLDRRHDDLTEPERAYIAAASALRRAEHAKAQRRRRNLFLGLATGLVVVSLFAAYAWLQRQTAREHLARSYWLAGVGDRDDRNEPLKAGHYFMASSHTATAPQTARHARFAAEFLNGDYHLDALLEHGAGLAGAAFDHAGMRVLSWGGASVQIWDAAGGTQRAVLKHGQTEVRGAAFAPYGRVLSWSTDGALRIWDTERTTAHRTMRHRAAVNGARFDNARQRLLSWSDDGSAILWDLESGEPIRRFEHAAPIRGAALDRQEALLLTWDADRAVRVWEIADAAPKPRVLAHPAAPRAAEFSDDGRRVLSWDDAGGVRLWDATSGQQLAEAVLENRVPIEGAALLPDGEGAVVWAKSGDVKLWRPDDDRPLRDTPLRSPEPVTGVGRSPDGRVLLSWGDDDTARLVALDSSGHWLDAPALELGHLDNIRGGRFSPDGGLVVTWGDDRSARVWDSRSGQLAAMPFVHLEPPVGAAWSPDGQRILSWSRAGVVRVWLRAEHPRDRLIANPEPLIAATAPQAAATVVAVDSQGTIRRWPIRGAPPPGHPVALEQERRQRGLHSARFSADGNDLATWDHDQISLWRTTSGARMAGPLHHPPSDWGGLQGVAFSRNGLALVSWGCDGAARVWNLVDGRLRRQVAHAGARECVGGAAFDPGGNRLATWGGRPALVIWDLASGEVSQRLSPTRHVKGAAWRSDGSQILEWDAGAEVRVWDAATGVRRPLPLAHTQRVRGARFGPDPDRILSWGDDGTARIWEAAEGRERATLRHRHPISGLAMAADGSLIATWAQNLVYLWARDPDSDAIALVTPRLLHRGRVAAVMFDDRGERLVVLSDGALRIWDLDIAAVSGARDPMAWQRLRTGTRLNLQSGLIEVLDAAEWRGLRQ